MIQVEFNKKNENPFYGLKNCLKLFQDNDNINFSTIDAAWNEVKDDSEKVKMFYSLCFSIGDVTNRQHNIFGKSKKDSGGMSQRESFFTFVNWLLNKNFDQFKKFLFAGLFNEYNCFDTLLRNRVQSTRSGKVIHTYTMLQNPKYRTLLAEYFYKVINSNNPFNKQLIAKFLTLPRLGKRSKHTKMLSETFGLMKAKADFLKELSDLMGWEYVYKGNFANFSGYRQWRKDYNGENEAVLFATGKINEFDRGEFITWLNKQPAGARFRVRNRVMFPDTKGGFKYPNLRLWYNEWEQSKEQAQQEQRVLEEKVRQNEASAEDIQKLKEVKKQAKVTTGATTFKELYKDIKMGNIDKVKLESFVNKVNLPYNSLVIVDDSGSMSGGPFNFAKFLASICLIKNPDDEGRNLIGMFNTSSRLYQYIDIKTKNPSNGLMRRQQGVHIQPEPFVDPHKSFYDNYLRISNFMEAKFESGGTNISSIPEGFHRMAQNNPELLDALKNYPIWTIISDGCFNQMYSPEASLNDFFRKCEMYFGYRPFIIAIDVFNWNVSKEWINAEQFSGIDNFMYIPGQPEIIEQMLLNFKDMDRFDVYTPLQSLYRSNRYDLIRANVI